MLIKVESGRRGKLNQRTKKGGAQTHMHNGEGWGEEPGAVASYSFRHDLAH
jgi:hypothetical protein